MPERVLARISPLRPPITPRPMGRAKLGVEDERIYCTVAMTKPPSVPRRIHVRMSRGGKPSRPTAFPAAI